MPIKDLTEVVRLPRLGKIHLGIKHPQKGYPMKTDYFVFPKDNSAYDTLVKLFTEKPKELRILIPVEDEETWASQYYKSYNQTRGLVCKGDGVNALRMIDSKTKELPTKETTQCEFTEMVCKSKDCPEYKGKKCHEVMNLRFLLPEVPGLGVWQIDTGSINSILNINSCADLIKRAFGRISLIPLKLTLEAIQVNNPEDGKKQNVFVLNLRTDVTLAQLADVAREQAKMFQIQAPNLEAAYEAELAEDIESLYGENEPEPKPKEKPIVVEPSKPEVKEAPATPPSTTEKQQPEATKPESNELDLEWVKTSLETLQGVGKEEWSNKNIAKYLSNISGKIAPSVSKAVSMLTKEQAHQFKAEIESALGEIKQ